MSLKTVIIAALFTATATTAFAQQTQQQQQQNPLRPTQPSTPTAPAAPTQPTAPRAAQPTAPAAAQPAQRAAPANQNQIVNLNTATKEQLDSLPQIGAARADAIIKGRPYRDWTDFTSKNIVPANAENAIKDRVRFR